MKKEAIVTEEQLPADVLEAVSEGRKVEAIKLLRERTGLGLANAKVLVDRAARVHGPQKPVMTFADEPSPLSGIGRSLGLLAILFAAYWFYTQH